MLFKNLIIVEIQRKNNFNRMNGPITKIYTYLFYTYLYTYIYIHMHIYIFVCVYVCVFACVYFYCKQETFSEGGLA